MKWNPEDEIEFIVRKLNHELTTAEERQFQCWLAEDQAHRSLFQEIESISLRSKEAKIVFEPDIELALQKVKSRRARMERLRHRIWQYAAFSFARYLNTLLESNQISFTSVRFK